MTTSPEREREQGAAPLLLAALLPLALLAWYLRFLVDDAFIAFRYAENWANEFGPVYHAGELVEGYSDLAWVFLLSIASRLGAPLDLSAQLISVFCALTTAALTVDVLRSLPLSKSARLAGALTVGLSANLAAWATGGLETALFTLALFGLWRELMRAEGSMWKAAVTCGGTSAPSAARASSRKLTGRLSPLSTATSAHHALALPASLPCCR